MRKPETLEKSKHESFQELSTKHPSNLNLRLEKFPQQNKKPHFIFIKNFKTSKIMKMSFSSTRILLNKFLCLTSFVIYDLDLDILMSLALVC